MAALDTVVRFAVMAPRRLPRKIAHLFGGIKGELRPDPDTFDQRTGLETAKLVHIYEADSINRNYVHSMGYEAVNEQAFRALIRRLPISTADYQFMDLGCGKGKSLFLAAEMGFEKCIGVEISPMLAEAASNNSQRWKGRGSISIVLGDVAEATWPNVPLVIFMYNPFDRVILQKAMQALHRSYQLCPRPIWIAYHSAVQAKYLDSLKWLTPESIDAGDRIYKVERDRSDS